METNIKLIEFGTSLYFWAKIIELEGHNIDVKQLQTICSNLGKMKIPATPL